LASWTARFRSRCSASEISASPEWRAAWSYMEPLSRSCSSGASKTFCSLWRRLTSTEAACDAQRFRGSINYFKYSQSLRKVKGKLTNSIEQLNKYSINIAK
jgi:hypothetical protein